MSEPLIEKNPIILAFMQKQKPVPYSLMLLKRDEWAKEQAYNKALIECAEIVQKAPTIDSVPAASCWVRCEDRLPPDGVDVLGCMEYSIGHKSLWVVHHTNTKDKVWNDGTITHWMPIEPPREGE